MVHTLLRRPSTSERLLIVFGKDLPGQQLFALVHFHLQLIFAQNLEALRPVLVSHPVVLDGDLVRAQSTGLGLSKWVEQGWERMGLFAGDRQPFHQAEVPVVYRVGHAQKAVRRLNLQASRSIDNSAMKQRQWFF